MKKVVNGETIEMTQDEIDELRSLVTPASPTITDYEDAVQDMIDATARERSYRSGDSLASFALSTNGKWAAEAQAFIAWRDNVWRYVFSEREKFLSGQRPQPTIEGFLSEIARIAWPVSL